MPWETSCQASRRSCPGVQQSVDADASGADEEKLRRAIDDTIHDGGVIK